MVCCYMPIQRSSCMKKIRLLLVIYCLQNATMLYAQYDTSEVSIADTSSISETVADPDDESDTSVLRTIDESAWKKIEDDKSFIYQRIKPKQKKEKQQELPQFDIIGIFTSGIFKALLFVLVGFALLFIIYHLLLNNEILFRKRKDIQPKVEAYDFEEVENFSEWEKALQLALAQNNYRLAVRILYLQTLHKLDEINLIRFEKQKTNWHYVTQMNTTPYGTKFIILTNYFDYVWYGEFTVNAHLFSEIESVFKNFQTDIS